MGNIQHFYFVVPGHSTGLGRVHWRLLTMQWNFFIFLESIDNDPLIGDRDIKELLQNDTLSDPACASADEYAVTAKLDASNAPSDSVPPTWGGSTNGKGNLWIKEDTGDIYIWA